jgi:hypothetical protein
MANSAINGLTAKTPVSTDLIPVADPTTGIAGKSTISQVISATSEDLVYTYTGTLSLPIYVVKSTPIWVGSGNPISGCHASFLYIRDNILLTELSLTNLVSTDKDISIDSMPNLTSISFPALTVVNNFTFGNLTLLNTINAPELITVVGSVNISSSLPAITSFNVPKLTNIGGGFTFIGGSSFASLNFPLLDRIGGNFNPRLSNAITSISVPELKTVAGAVNIDQLPALTTMSFPKLTVIVGALSANGSGALTSVSLPSIEIIAISLTTGSAIGFTSGTASLTDFNIGSSIKRVGGTAGNVLFTSCALNQASVDNILVRLAALDGTGGTTAFSNRTVTITGTSSTPSATGLSAKATLVARGCTVTNN